MVESEERVLITGGTGFCGSNLHDLVTLLQNPPDIEHSETSLKQLE